MSNVADIKNGIQKFFGDTSRSRAETRDGLDEIIECAQQYIEALEDTDEE